MTLRFRLLAVVVLGCASLAPLARAQAAESAAPAPAKSQMDIDYDAVWAFYKAEPTDPELRKNDPKAWYRFQDDHMRQFAEAARAYAAKYPHDQRRYNPLIQSSYTRPRFITGFKPEFDATPRDQNLIVNEPALIAFWEAQLKYLAEVIEAPEAELRQRGGAIVAYLIDSRSLARTKGETYDLLAAGPLVERAMAKVTNETILPVVDTYLAALRRDAPEAAKAFEAKIQSSPKIAALVAEQDAQRAAAAAERAKKLTALAEMKFTAVDGREVEIAKLKGKVVLIDFWATWCGPCIAELPNVKKVYAAYHDRGFEVIGITLENAGLSGKEAPEAAAKKLAAAKEKLVDFTAKNAMPWPQYFDGLHWKNPYRGQFGIEGIPAMFLLDKTGTLVSTEARGEKLESEVKRLLGL